MSRWRFGALVAAGLVGAASWVLGTSPASAAPACTVEGGPGDDVLLGTPDRDVICGLGGDDTLVGRRGNDLLIGGDGDDSLRPGLGEDRAVGGPDTDDVTYWDLPSPISVRIDLEAKAVRGGGADELVSVEVAKGTRRDDVIVGTDGPDLLVGFGGADVVVGGLGDDRLLGRPGADTLHAGEGTNTVFGGSGDDLLTAGDDDDRLWGGTDSGAPGDECRGAGGSNSIRLCEIIDNPATLTIAPAPHDFGIAVTGTTTAAQTFTVTNTGGTFTGPISIVHGDPSGFPMSNDTCTGTKLAASASCTVDFAFAPASLGLVTADPQVSATPGGATSTTLEGTGVEDANLTISPTPHEFGGVVNGSTSSPQAFTVTNTGGVPTGTVTVSTSGGSEAEFVVSNDTCSGAPLGAGSSCTVDAAFAPTTAGGKATSLQATGSPGGTASSALSGTGLDPANLVLSPSSHDYGSVLVGTSSAVHTVTVTNTGDVSASLSSLTSSGNVNDFALDVSNCSAAGPLDGGESCSLLVTFMPSLTGTRSVTLRGSWAGGAEQSNVVTLTGEGAATAANLEIGITGSQAQPPTVWGSSASVTLGTTPPGMGHGVSAVIWYRNTGEADAHISNSPVPLTLSNALIELFPSANSCGVNGPPAVPQTQLTFSDLVIEGGTTCSFPMRVIPEATGPVSVSFTVNGSPGGNVTANLAMTGS